MHVRLLEQAAVMSNADAQYALGTAYLMGTGVAQDAARAQASKARAELCKDAIVQRESLLGAEAERLHHNGLRGPFVRWSFPTRSSSLRARP